MDELLNWGLGIILLISLIMTEGVEGFLLAIVIIALLIYFKIVLPAKQRRETEARQTAYQVELKSKLDEEKSRFYNRLKSGPLYKSCLERIQGYCDFFNSTDFDILKGDIYITLIIPASSYGHFIAFSDIYNDDFRLRQLLNSELCLFMLNANTEYFAQLKSEARNINDHISIGSDDMKQFLLEHGMPKTLLNQNLTIETLDNDRIRFTTNLAWDSEFYANLSFLNHYDRLKILNELLKDAYPCQNIHINVLPQIF